MNISEEGVSQLVLVLCDFIHHLGFSEDGTFHELVLFTFSGLGLSGCEILTNEIAWGVLHAVAG
jgi:hypothetical protein